DVVNEYLAHGDSNNDRFLNLDSIPRTNAGDNRLRLEGLEWLCDLPLRHGEQIKARINLSTRIPLSHVALGIGFSSIEGKRLVTYDMDHQQSSLRFARPGRYCVEIEIVSLPLAPDIYLLDIGSRSGDFHSLDYIPAVAQLEIVAGPSTPGYIVRRGAGVRLASKWRWLHGKVEHASAMAPTTSI